MKLSHHVHQLEYLAIIQSFDDAEPSRDLVHLVHQDRCDFAGLLMPFIPSLVYENVGDIPRLVTQSQSVCDLFAELGPCILDAEFTGDIKDPEVSVGHSTETEIVDLANQSNKWSNPTEQEIAAACRIQMAYRLHRIRHAPATRRSKQWGTEVHKYFIECLSEVLFWHWKRDAYRGIYLNKLPVLLVCLDRGLKIASTMKSKASTRMLRASGHELEDARGCINRST